MLLELVLSGLVGSVAVLPRGHQACAAIDRAIEVPIRLVSRSGLPVPPVVRALVWTFKDGEESFGEIGRRHLVGKGGWALIDRLSRSPDGKTYSLFLELLASDEGFRAPNTPTFVVGGPACVIVILD
jgi:hypothetical protein